jgi:hypothetical protein
MNKVKDGMGFDMIKNPDGQGLTPSETSVAAWQEWVKKNPPPNDGYAYESSPLYPQWQRRGPLRKVEK